MDGSFCNQVLAQMYLYKNAFADRDEGKKNIFVKILPRELDEEIASLMVQGFGGTMTKLTNQQRKYLGIFEKSHKSETYKY